MPCYGLAEFRVTWRGERSSRSRLTMFFRQTLSSFPEKYRLKS